MLDAKQIEEIKEHLNKAQNPVFFYDNDADGLCSFLLLRRYIGRGKGVAVKSYPDLNIQYLRRVVEFKSDYIFILDKPVISEEFVKEVDKMQIPIVWIDHHMIKGANLFENYSNIHFYNPAYCGEIKSNEPVTYLVYNVCGKKEDLWIAVMGCIADHFMPDFAEEFGKEYPEFWKKEILGPFDAYYKSEIGKIAQAVGFGLKDSITNVTAMQSFLISCKSPQDVFSESEKNNAFRNKYREIRKKYDYLISEARKNVEGNLVFFQYSGDLSISSEISNELNYIFPEKYVAVAFIKGSISNISMRGENVKDILDRVLAKLECASGGGHDNAVGLRIRTSDMQKFKEILIWEINNGRS